MDVGRGFFAAGRFEITATRRAGADEHRVEVLSQHGFQGLNFFAGFQLDVADVENVIDFFVDHFFGQTKARYLRAHEAAAFLVGFVNGDLITQRRQIARHRQRGGARADAGDALAVFLRRRFGHARGYAIFDFVVGGDALQAADGYRLGLGFAVFTGSNRFAQIDVALFHAAPAARRFARAVTGASQDAGKHIRFPVDHVGIVVLARSDHADVFGNGRVRRAGVLTIDDFMKVLRVRNIGGFQSLLRAYTNNHGDLL